MVRRPPASLAGLALALAAGLGFSGCLSDGEMIGGPGDTVDVFPKPQGPQVLPLRMETLASYRYAGFDSSGAPQRIGTVPLRIGMRGKDTFSYAFEDTGRGYLVCYRDWGVRDSSGIYILGSFEGKSDTWFASPVLWLPQFPAVGAIWSLHDGRTLEAVAVDAPYYTGVLVTDDPEAPVVGGFQRHSAYHLKETAGGVTTHWWLRKGVGLLGFQRSSGGRLLASGTLETLYTVRRYTHLW